MEIKEELQERLKDAVPVFWNNNWNYLGRLEQNIEQ